MGKEVILNIIREVSKFDFVDYPNKKKAPRDAKFKIVFYKPPPKSKTNIPKKFQGLQIFQNKKEAQKALKERKELTKDLQRWRAEDMIGNQRLDGYQHFGDQSNLIQNRPEVIKLKQKKIDLANELFKKGYKKSEILRMVIKELKLKRNIESRSWPKWLTNIK